MKRIKKIFAVSIMLITIIFHFPKSSFSSEIIPSSRDNITTHLPESVGTPEKDISGETAKVSSGKGGKKWIWAVVSVAVIAGIVAVAGSGGGGDGGNNGGGTGSINISW
ncbi:MAG: hypothetical protein A2Z47_15705 [Thermodesulfovibrio sp. RBG_19FT_COMBO_42_12]|nr:MAG: hypothetical protein A2Z47_15705 [Thermodesulfovibrio sp. RBG_19FT_COMBO_42_12]HZX47978.1 hypothetical protein [Nitrospirota bacterium]